MATIQRCPDRGVLRPGLLIAAPLLHAESALAFTWGESDWGSAFWGIAAAIESIPALPGFSLVALLVGATALAIHRLHHYRSRGTQQ